MTCAICGRNSCTSAFHSIEEQESSESHRLMMKKIREQSSPTIVCLCGSTRFSDAFQKANLDETLAGRIVLTVGCMTHSDRELGESVITPEIKVKLDELHKKKIDLSDEILVLNVGGYIGESTAGEIAHAFARGKRIRFLDEAKGEAYLEAQTHRLGKMMAESLR